MVLKFMTKLMSQLAPDQFVKAAEKVLGEGQKVTSGESFIPFILMVITLAVIKLSCSLNGCNNVHFY